jgi:uncharacterized membrane protein
MMYGRGYGYGGYGDMMGGGGWIVGLLMMTFGLLVIATIVLLVVWAIRASSSHGHGSVTQSPSPAARGHDEAVAIAKKRLAGGEIGPDEYAEIMRQLGG